MYGFQPKHARGKPAQALADGGLVHSITGMLGMRKRTPEEMLVADAKVQERNREAAARVAARAKPAQQAAPAEEKAVSSYAGMSAMQRREKELGLKDGGSVGGFKPGGLIRGPGTGTSDSIETEKRPGTFIMPADSTQAIGLEALERLGESEEMEVDDEREMDDDAEEGEEPEGEKVPVRLSNGEFELPPEQVQALGEAVLTVLRDATRQPVGEHGKAPTGKGFTPHQFFADGGTVQRAMNLIGGRKKQIDEATKVAVQTPRQPEPRPVVTSTPDGKFDEKRASNDNPAGIGFADGGRVRPRGFVVGPGTETSDSIPARLSAGEYVLPADTVKAVGVDQLDALREATHKPVKGEGAKAARGFFAGGTPGGLDEAYKSWQDKKTPWYMPTPAGNMEERTAEAAYTQALRNSYSGNSSPSATGQPGWPSRQAAPAPAGATATAGAGRGSINPASVNPTQPAAAATEQTNAATDTAAAPTQPPPSTAAAPQPQAEQVAPGAYRHGRGQYSDNAAGMGMPANFTGQPSAQNMAAADALAARSQQASMGRALSEPAGLQPQGVTAPTVRHSGNDWAARNALRNAEASASSIMNTRRWGGRGAENNPSVLAYQAMLKNDLALQGAQPGVDVAAMRENAGITREGMQQAGATTRTGMQEQGSNAREAGRNALAQGEFGLKKEAAGFQTRALQRLESLQNRYEAEKDPAKRGDLARQIREIQGKEQPSEWGIQVTPATKNADGSTTEGSVIRYNKATGQAERVDTGAPAPIAAPKAGEVRNGYRFKGGNPNDQANWAKV